MPDRLPASTGLFFVGESNVRGDIYAAIDATKQPALQQRGKVVLVTGASRGIGEAIAVQYAHAGVAALILVSRSTDALETVADKVRKINSGIDVLVRSVDVKSEAAINALATEIRDKYKRLDVLINNAGAAEPWVPLVESDAAQWWNTFEVNVRGPYLFLRALLPLLAETASASEISRTHVVNTSSIGATITTPEASAYCMSKLALDFLSEFSSNETAHQGVTVVSVHPGGVETTLAEGRKILKGLLNDTPALAGGWCVWMTAEPREWLGGRYVSATWDVDALLAKKEEIVAGDKLKKRMVV